MSLLKDIIVWKYERASPQWDVLCVLILAFIFLTPKTWFDKREKLSATPTARLIVKAEDFSTTGKSSMEKRVKELSGNPNAEILNVGEQRDANGNKYQVIDIR